MSTEAHIVSFRLIGTRVEDGKTYIRVLLLAKAEVSQIGSAACGLFQGSSRKDTRNYNQESGTHIPVPAPQSRLMKTALLMMMQKGGVASRSCGTVESTRVNRRE